MSFVSGGDLLQCAKLAYQLYDFGFKRAQNADRLYADFGADIQHLGKSLEKLADVISKVSGQVPRSISSTDYSWDLESSRQILGNFKKTIVDCNVLLRTQSAFSKDNQGFVSNVRWNLTIQPDVVRLRERVAFHNSKIATILKPLELKLLLDLRSMIARIDSRLQDVQESLARIERLLLRNSGNLSIEPSQTQSGLLDIPDYLEEMFNSASQAAYPDLVEVDKFPLVGGIDAFHRHFDQSTISFKPEASLLPDDLVVERMPEPTQYLNLMKSVWIVKRVRSGYEYKDASADKMWSCYLDELERKCRRECVRFTTREPRETRLKKPDDNNLFLLQEDQFRITLLEDIETDGDDMESSDYMNEILRVPLHSQIRNRKQELVLLRYGGVEDRIAVHSLSSNLSVPQNPQKTISELDLTKVHLLPLYANPKSTALNLTFKPDSRSGNTTILSFRKLKDLLDFQQAITSYKVVLDKSDIQAQIYQSTGLFSGKSSTERGRLQIWYLRPLDRLSDFPEKSISNIAEGVSPPGRRFSEATTSTPSAQESTAPSVHTFTTAFTSPIALQNTTSYNFKLPPLPLVMFYLENKKSQLSFLRIQIDEKTTLALGRCTCLRNAPSCTHATLERNAGLQYERRMALDSSDWNIAAFGVHQLRSQEADKRERMKYVQLNFKDGPDREAFVKMFEQTKYIWKRQTEAYWRESETVSSNRDVGG